MKKIIVTILALSALFSSVSYAQHHDKNHAPASIAGTWDMTLQSHQLALVLKQDGKKVTGTLMLPGKDVAVAGEYVDGKLTLATTESGAMEMKLEGKLQEDGTLAGEFASARGKSTWTAERLKERK